MCIAATLITHLFIPFSMHFSGISTNGDALYETADEQEC